MISRRNIERQSKMSKKSNYILLLPILSGILFGSAGVFVRTFTEFGMSNPTLIFLRTSIASIFLFILILCTDKSRLKVKLRDFPLFIGTGLIAMLGVNLCYNYAVNTLSLSLAAVLLSTSPIFVLIIAAILFKEKITKKKVIGAALAIIGCLLSTGILENVGSTNLSSLGIFLGICSAVFYGLYSIISRIATDRGYHTYTIIFYSVLLIAIALIPFVQFDIAANYVAVAPAWHTVVLILHALCTSVLPYVFLTYALMHAEAGTVSILASGGEPVSAAVFGVIVYSEIPSLLMILGLAIVIYALVLLCR